MAKVILDLGELDVAEAAEKGAEIELKHPTAQTGLGQYIGVLGKDSQAFRDYVSHKTNEARRKEAVAARRGRQPEITTFEESEIEAATLLAACTTHFRCDTVPGTKDDFGKEVGGREGGPFLYYRGQKLEFNTSNAVKFYSDPGMAEFRKQIDKAIVDLENFIKG